MKKKIKVKIKNDEEEQENIYSSIFSENQIQYIEKKNTKVKVNRKDFILTRENEDMKMEYFFKEKKGNLFLKKYKRVLPIVLKVKKITNEKEKLIIEYEVENMHFYYSIDWRKI